MAELVAPDDVALGSPPVKLTMTWDDVLVVMTATPRYPIAVRYQALFFAKPCAPSSEDYVKVLSDALAHETSILMRHEICYVLGQSGNALAVPILKGIMHDSSEDEITRHEAAEGLAALDAEGLLDDLSRYGEDDRSSLPLLTDTCMLAIDGLAQKNDARVCGCLDGEKVPGGRFVSRDPAKGDTTATAADVPALEAMLLDQSKPLFARYAAMFTLRDLAASGGLAKALAADTSSACFRHEACFVLAQLEDLTTVPALVAKLADPAEHAVVRHEAAIALSAMGDSDEAKPALEKFLADPDPLVNESCAAALSTMAYWHAWEDKEARLRNDDES